MQKLLLVDFDGTLFNSDLFHKDISLYLNNTYKTSFEDFNRSFEEAKADGPHSLKKQLNILHLRNVNGLIKEIKEHLMSTNRNYIYEDTLEFIKKNKKQMVIFTFAEPSYYKFKLAVSGLNKHRIPLLATNMSNKNQFLQDNLSLGRELRKKISDPETVIWIDDKSDVFKNKIEGINFVRIKREGGKHSHKETPEHATEITSLLQINEQN